MVKCWAKSPNGIKCQKELVECLQSHGQHVGRRFLGVKAGKFLNEAWLDSTSPDTSSPEGQRKLAAEIRRLRFMRLDASRLRQPKQYAAFHNKLGLLATFVVKERKNRFGVTVKINAGTALPVHQQRLIE